MSTETPSSKRGYVDVRIWEPVEAWKRYVNQMRTILRMAAQLTLKGTANAEDWKTVEACDIPSFDDYPYPGLRRGAGDDAEPVRLWSPPPSIKSNAARRLGIDERLGLTYCVGHWFKFGRIGVGPRPPRQTDKAKQLLTLKVWSHGLCGRLALELAATLSSPLGVYICDSCGNGYQPRVRRPRRGVDAHYCWNCSEGTGKASKRDWARRQR